MINRTLSVFICGILLLVTFTGCESGDLADLTISENPGYTYTTYDGMSEKGDVFLACGTNGRFDRIYTDNTVENVPIDSDMDLTQILKWSNITLISGRAGTLLYSIDGQSFSSCGITSNRDILGITHFKDRFYACVSDGSLFASDDGISWRLSAQPTKKPIIAIGSNDVYCMAITADTDIIITEDGITWDLQNFNEVYDGFYEKYEFTNLLALGMSIFILGFPAEDPDCPMVMFSDSGGEVWMFKTLDEINNEEPRSYFPMRINSICSFDGELYGACSGGRVVTISSCSSCNLVADVATADLRSIAVSEGAALAVGDDFQFVFKGFLNPSQDDN